MQTEAVYGPPGTGKTTYMMNSVEKLIRSGYLPSEIMYLSFTKAAAGEVLKRMGVRTSSTVSTIHSACYRLLNLAGSQVIAYRHLMQFSAIVGIPFKGNSDDAQETMELGDQYLALQQLARSRLQPWEQTYEDSDRPGTEDEFRYFVESYDSWRESNGLIDFTDMLEQYTSSQETHGCKVIYVDEAQDLSPLQWQVIRDFVNQDSVERCIIAGDDDQSIFEWAGADPHGMVTFEEEHKAERTILTQSWRVPAMVHEIVVGISSQIQTRVDKPYKPRDALGQVLWSEMFEPTDQKEGYILCRTHSIKEKLQKLLIERRVPFLAEGGGLPGPFSSKAAKAVRAWKRYKDTGRLQPKDLELMIAAANDRVRGDLVGGDKTSILKEDPMRIFRMPHIFLDYFRDVDIHEEPQLTTMTIHNSKGREADEVTVIQDWTGRVEAGFVKNPDQEHRTWYVATSRAKKVLRLTGLGESGYVIDWQPTSLEA